MKTIGSLCLFCIVFTLNAFSQKTIEAEKIISMIDNGKEVQLENVTIKGALEFVKVRNREVKNKSLFGTDTYHCYVKVPVSFRNCTFRDDVVAY